MSRPVHQALLARGLCRQCCKPIGEDPRKPGHRTGPPRLCGPCLKKAGAYNQVRRGRRKDAGLCVLCGNNRHGVDTATEGTPTMCRLCSDKQNLIHNPEQKARRARWKAAGMCTRCGHDRGVNATPTMCRACADRSSASKRVRRRTRKAIA